MVRPDFFSVDYVINPHMEGQIGQVDQARATEQWRHIRDLFASLQLTVHELDGQPGLPDMVFSANQSLPFIDKEGQKGAVMSIMHSDQRKGEVPYIEQWYRRNGYALMHLDHTRIHDFEGMGDALWHPRRRLLWGGYGFRSSLQAYHDLAGRLDTDVIALELQHPSFYHLDTCLCMLDEGSVLIYPEAFSEQGRAMIHEQFDRVIKVPKQEAEELFACNASCPDGRNVIIQRGCTETVTGLQQHGYTVHEVDTDEFLKSGGSVFCMKLMLW